MFWLPLIMTVSGLITICFSRNHLLLILLSLEFLSLSNFFLIFLVMFNFNYELYFTLMLMILSVCEGALGLSILVSMVRCHGNDYLSSISILSW